MISKNALTELAKDRTILANERTLLSYIRTAIMVTATGITLLKLFVDQTHFEIMGIVLIPCGLLIAVYGYLRYRKICTRIHDTITEDLQQN